MTPGDTRRAGINWGIGDGKSEDVTQDDALLAVAMDIRDELKRLNQLLHCPNFIGIPAYLRNVARYTKRIPARKRKPRAKV